MWSFSHEQSERKLDHVIIYTLLFTRYYLHVIIYTLLCVISPAIVVQFLSYYQVDY